MSAAATTRRRDSESDGSLCLDRTLVAANGQEALTLLSTFGPRAILAVVTDFYMPVMDGLQLAAAIREQWPMIPLLLVSARPPETWAGAFLPKPFSPPDLVAAVKDLLPPQPAGATGVGT